MSWNIANYRINMAEGSRSSLAWLVYIPLLMVTLVKSVLKMRAHGQTGVRNTGIWVAFFGAGWQCLYRFLKYINNWNFFSQKKMWVDSDSQRRDQFSLSWVGTQHHSCSWIWPLCLLIWAWINFRWIYPQKIPSQLRSLNCFQTDFSATTLK